MPSRRFAAPLVALVCSIGVLIGAGIGLAPAAWSAPDVQQAAAALRGGSPVYSAPGAENGLSSDEVTQLSDQARATEVPMFIAVLPDAAKGGGTIDDTLTALKDAVGLAGVYAVG
jgi:hypothetical protein